MWIFPSTSIQKGKRDPMLAVVGIIPDESVPVIYGKVSVNEVISVKDYFFAIDRGTCALIASCFEVLKYFNKHDELMVFLVGDTGKGYGSLKLYDFISKNIQNFPLKLITFHYIMPNIDGFLKVFSALEGINNRPFLIADAGFMYVTKMAGYASYFDLFTPDMGELAFLADEKAPHPFYTRGFILNHHGDPAELIKMAYKHQNASKYMIVKGEKDYIVKQEEIVNVVDEPNDPALEAIGGTGDTLTGIVSALIYLGFKPQIACYYAAKLNRIAGILSNANPATQIKEIIKQIGKSIYQFKPLKKLCLPE